MGQLRLRAIGPGSEPMVKKDDDVCLGPNLDEPNNKNLALSTDIYLNKNSLPPLKPPIGFKWQFLGGTWAMIPDSVSLSADGDNLS